MLVSWRKLEEMDQLITALDTLKRKKKKKRIQNHIKTPWSNHRSSLFKYFSSVDEGLPLLKKKKKVGFIFTSQWSWNIPRFACLIVWAGKQQKACPLGGRKGYWTSRGNGVGKQNSKHASADWSLAYSWGWQAKCNDSASITYRGGDGFKNWVLLNPCHSCQEQQKGYSRERWLISAVNTPGLMTGLRWWFVPCALRFIPAIDFKICS